MYKTLSSAIGWPILRSFLHALEAEQAHNITLRALELMPPELMPALHDYSPELKVRLWSYDFPSPVGLAAGMDKDARCYNAIYKLGFGFVECGTVTKYPQGGNPKPRLFRISSEQAIVNRMGFNNAGIEAMLNNLVNKPPQGILGINIGVNRNIAADSIAQHYAYCLKTLYKHAHYFVINVSSPNTQGLRKWEEPEALGALLKELVAYRNTLSEPRKPLLVKLSADLADVYGAGQACLDSGIDGIIACNTTVNHNQCRHGERLEGGLSGRPLYQRAIEVISQLWQATEGKLPLIGVGGISSAEDAYRMLAHGASLVQVYTGLVYQGAQLVSDINQGLVDMLKEQDIASISDIPRPNLVTKGAVAAKKLLDKSGRKKAKA